MPSTIAANAASKPTPDANGNTNKPTPDARSRPVRYQLECALISMMARSTARFNQRPDTLMQDRI
ncbi:hypothetical protein CWO91_11280 [Bradyrhizobium genosp. SA-3]|nr:hypothetical protein CWO91_11280 [Bradyrhizobium genosp. SA-3]